MSIVSLASGNAPSSIDIEGLHRLAAELNFNISNDEDAEAYLLFLRSFEGVMLHIEDSEEYIHPSLSPQSVVGSRDFWKPGAKDNPLNAWSHRCEIQAASPTSDILKGRSIVIKDNVSVGGLPTTLGTHPEILSKDGTLPLSPIDATVVARVLSSGAIVKGSSTCENYCASPLAFTSVTGPVHHPLLHGYTTGGSSSGSCALVASTKLQKTSDKHLGETVELAIGSDQAGSIRIPASYTGIYGLKPTFGLIPYTGAASMTPMIDYLGPLASSLEDIASLLQVMAGYDGIDPRMTPESPLVSNVKDYPKLLAEDRLMVSARSDTERPVMKVGLLDESFNVPGLSSEVRDVVRQAAREVFEAAGAEVIDVSVPMHSEGPIIWTASTRPSMSSWLNQGKPSGHLSYLSPHLQSQWPPSQDIYEALTASNPAVINILLSEKFDKAHMSPSLEAKAHRKVFQLRAAYDEALSKVDVLITPCAPTIAMPHPDPKASILERLKPAIGLTSNTCPFNVTGHPAMNVPCGTLPAPEHPEVHFPVGMQVIGRRWEDEVVLRAAALFEAGMKLTR